MDVLGRTILITLTGSQAYGLATDNSDSDYKGICIAEPKYYLGLQKFEQKDKGWDKIDSRFPYLEKDTVIYDIKKFFKLAIQANPNILDIIFSPSYTYITELGAEICKYKQEFLSKEVNFSYGGYAVSQIKKCESHRKWLLDPPSGPPKLEDYELNDKTVIHKNEAYAFYNYLFELTKIKFDYAEEVLLVKKELRQKLDEFIDLKQSILDNSVPSDCMNYVAQITDCSINYLERLQKTNLYLKDLQRWKSYCEWKKNRNPKRAELENKIKYDSKHIMHCIRLLKTSIEILDKQELIIDRRVAGDAEELMEIRNGLVPYDDIMKRVSQYQEQVKKSYESSTLQRYPNTEKLEELCINLITKFNS